MLIWYKNSFLASVVSILGCMLAVGGIAAISEGGAAAAVCLIAVGIALAIWGRSISDNKAFKKWWQQVIDANLVAEIAASEETAIQIYNKNPGKRTLKKIAELNPSAAANIQAQLAAKKK